MQDRISIESLGLALLGASVAAVSGFVLAALVVSGEHASARGWAALIAGSIGGATLFLVGVADTISQFRSATRSNRRIATRMTIEDADARALLLEALVQLAEEEVTVRDVYLHLTGTPVTDARLAQASAPSNEGRRRPNEFGRRLEMLAPIDVDLIIYGSSLATDERVATPDGEQIKKLGQLFSLNESRVSEAIRTRRRIDET